MKYSKSKVKKINETSESELIPKSLGSIYFLL